MKNLSDKDLKSIRKIVLDQLDTLRNTRDSLDGEGKMNDPLRTAINKECDWLNSLDTRIGEAIQN